MLNPVKHQTYLVTVYNKAVRALLKENRSHAFFSDLWADAHTQNVSAPSEADAHREAARRYPPEQGFVIERIVLAS